MIIFFKFNICFYCLGLCTDTQYFDGFKCYDKVGEFLNCTFDDMCFSPMFCSSFNCTCGTLHFYNHQISNCEEQRLLAEECLSNHHCREDKLLLCEFGICKCPTGFSWSMDTESCKLSYSFGVCNQLSDCNSNEELICATNTNCNCPSNSSIGHCDCIRLNGNEKFWNLSKCVDAFPINASCSEDYECRTLTQFAKCINGKCDCELPGGLTSLNKCKKCQDGDFYFNDKCYFFSDSFDLRSRDSARDNCPNVRNFKQISLKYHIKFFI